MAKRGGRKGKSRNKSKSSGGGGAKKGTAVQNITTPGHQVEDRTQYSEGEGATAATKGDAPEAAAATVTAAAAGTTASTNVPSAAPESAAAPSEEQEEQEEPVAPAESAAVAEESTTAPVTKDSKETAEVLPVSKEPVPTETSAATSESLITSAINDVSKKETTETLPLAGSAVAAGTVTTTLAERPKSKEAQDNEKSATATTAAVGSSVAEPHAKRPYEASPLIQDETKPHKLPKVDDFDVTAPIKANGALQDGKNPDLHIPGTFPGTPSVSESSAAAASATTGRPLEVSGLKSGETSEKDLETQPTTEATATDVPESQDTATKDVSIAATVAPETAAIHKETKEPETEAQKVTEPAVAVTKEQVSDYSTATTTVPVETKAIEGELQKVAEPAAAVTKEQVSGPAANGKPSTPIPSVVVNQPESINITVGDSSSAVPAGPAGAGAVAAGLHSAEGAPPDKVDLSSQAVRKEDVEKAEAALQSLEAADQAITGPVSGEAKPSEGATAQEPSANGGREAGINSPAVNQLQSTIAQAKEKSAELENKTKEFEKRRKGGLFGWLKRKIKGEKAEK